MRILVVSNLYPPAVRGGYEMECAGVVDHLRRSHEVHVLTSTNGSGGEDVLRALPLLEENASGALRAPFAAMRAARVARREAAVFRPELVFVWNGSQIPHAALRVLDGLGAPVAFRIMEHWFTRMYGDGDQFMRHLEPGERGLRGAWASGVRTLNRLDPALRLDPHRRVRAAVCWVSRALAESSPAPPVVDVAHEEVLFPSTPNVERFAQVVRSPDAEPLLLYASRVERQKGPDVVIRALARLAGELPTARLVLAGGEDEAFGRELRALAAELGVAARVEFLGRVEPGALAELAARAHVWLMPSVWEEPAPNGCVEAALARVPLVASRVGGIPEVTVDGVHGLLFTPGDDEDCARAVSETLRDPLGTARRVEAAAGRAQGMRRAPYLARMDRFLEQAVEALAGR